MDPIKNIFICLVHENQDCCIDLIRNLKYLDPKSKIILYNGGTNTDLFRYFPFERYDVAIHPSPRPLKWGWLHDFAIDCMEYAIENFEFDLITVVDSDQLACGKNYTDFVTETFCENPNMGMLGQMTSRIQQDTIIDPAITAYHERELWEPFLSQLPNGKEAFLYWTFWPSTAFTYNASVDLVKLFRTNLQLREILGRTKIWASEEILLPTLVMALGYSIVENPCSYDFVKYRAVYGPTDIKKAIEKSNSFWIHPVERKINDANRSVIRQYYGHYSSLHAPSLSNTAISAHSIFQKTNHIEGWLQYDELELLVDTCAKKITTKENPVIVEIGSYCGKATAVMALAARAVNDKTKIIAIDDFSGRLGAEDSLIEQYAPSLEKFQKTLDHFALAGEVEIVIKTPYLADCKYDIDILLVDGLHDYAAVARDFFAFEKKIYQEGMILFHDYGPTFPGVVAFVDELVASGLYEMVNLQSSLIVLKRIGNKAVADSKMHDQGAIWNKVLPKARLPLVSCIMPTYNRPEFITHAVYQFLQQDYPNKELIIIDDSKESIARLIPEIESVNYSYQGTKLDLGTKRNLACMKAKGEIIVHLDDDDFYASDWLTKQVSFLIEQDLEVTGLSNPVFYDKDTTTVWQYIYPEKEKSWVYGATLCYTKKIWQSNPFPVTNCGEDNMFVWSNTVKKIRPHTEVDSYIGQIHAQNTSPKELKNTRWSKLKEEQARKILKYHQLD